ncbi:hypothetical protein BDZ97DRAFT_2073670 [Flammula alnicola]|nr:hypothetical protein BDZ97DRAFT_2073670 [Flammula alnicola]
METSPPGAGHRKIVDEETPVNLLSLDGGGIRGVSELTILHEIMSRVQARKGLAELPKPCDYFHLIGGTSTGGLISIMLGRLQMTTEQAMEKYNLIAEKIFSNKNRKLKAQDGTFKSTTLKEEIQKVVAGTFEGYTGEELMFDHSVANEMGKAFVCAVSADNMRFITRFRTYRVDKNQSSNCKIWEAARATTAAATFFKRIELAGVGGVKKPFLDAGIKCNNPVVEVREEARQIFGDGRKLGVLVSLGTGQPGTIGLKKPDAFQKLLPTELIDTLKSVATDCEAVADALTTQFITHPSVYFRFNVTHGAGEVSLEEWKMIGTIIAHTESYLRDAQVSAHVDSVVSHLCGEPQRAPSLTLAALCGVPQPPTVTNSSSIQALLVIDPFKYLPSPPDSMFGRDAEKDAVLDVLLNNEPAHVVILGGGGMGKTTLSQFVLHDKQVLAKYGTQYRYFVSCEGVTTANELLFELANALRIPAMDRKDDLDQRVLSALRQQPAVLCLDNFETIWEVERPPRPVEKVLSQFAAISTLAIIITMRGTQTPQVPWSELCRLDLQPLGLDSSTQIVEMIYGKVDEFTKKLLIEVDGIPLAVKLLASLLRDGESSDNLWRRWERERTEMIEIGNPDRLSNLDTSIQLSLNSPRMRADNNAAAVLGMLSLLPDGFPDDVTSLDRLIHHLPEDIQLDKLLQTLTRVSLAYVDATRTPRRIRILSPIRHICTRATMQPNLGAHIVAFYVKLISNNSDYSDGSLHPIIQPELLNIHSVLVVGYNITPVEETLVQASIDYTGWALYVGSPVDDVINLAIESVPRQLLLAECLFQISKVYKRRCQLDKAETSLKHAIELYHKAQDAHGEADCLNSLGELYMYRDQLDEAEASFKHAIELHHKAQSVLGEANSLRSLGDLCMYRGQLEEAEALFKNTIELYHKAQSVLGEANSLNSVGDLYMLRGQLDEAEALFKRAIKLYHEVQCILGEANCLNSVGDLYMRRDQLDNAETLFKHAIKLHHKAQSILGEANSLRSLGDLCMRRDQLDNAEILFKHAIELHQKAQNVLGEANSVKSLGDLCMRRDQLDNAETLFKHAIELYHKAQDVLGEANSVKSLGDLWMHLGQLDEAEASFKHAIVLYHKVQDVRGEADSLRSLGDLYMRRDQLDGAETSFKHAIELYHKAQDVLGEANSLRSLGDLWMHQLQFDDTEAPFKRAVELYHKAQSVLGEANSLRSLGDLYMCRDQLEEAEISFKHAIEFSRKAQSVLGEANSLWSLGDLHMQQEQLEEAETSFKYAIELYRQAQDLEGEAKSSRSLGDLYIRRGQLDDAETSFRRAIELYRQAQYLGGEADSRAALQKLQMQRTQGLLSAA